MISDGELSVFSILYDLLSLLYLSSFVGAISTFAFGENIGRKKTFLIGVTIMSIGAILQTSSFSLAQMIVARLITGKLTTIDFISFFCYDLTRIRRCREWH